MSDALVVLATVCYCAQIVRRGEEPESIGFLETRTGDVLSASAICCWSLLMIVHALWHPQREDWLDSSFFTAALLVLFSATAVTRTLSEVLCTRAWRTCSSLVLCVTLLCLLVPTFGSGRADGLSLATLSLILIHWQCEQGPLALCIGSDVCLAACVHLHALRS